MDIIYTAKAKNDLIKIHWKTRNLIISNFSKLKTMKKSSIINYKPLLNSDLQKFDFNEYVAISKIEKDKINILTVIEKRKIKIPEFNQD
jgi:mRNA-degrading endonuclease RelE of RelBE toxin-antitoxin system